VERVLQVLGVRRWREMVTDRKKWKEIVRQAKAHSGLWPVEQEEEGEVCWAFFCLCKIITTRASPLGIPLDIYRGRTQIRVKM
jgi:hypothetical protein